MDNVKEQKQLSESTDSSLREPNKGLLFPERLHNLLGDSEKSSNSSTAVAWAPSGRCFKVLKKEVFTEDVLPRYFKQSKYKSFVRQLNIWGFCCITEGPERGYYTHPFFVKGRRDLCNRMVREKIKGTRHTRGVGASKRRSTNSTNMNIAASKHNNNSNSNHMMYEISWPKMPDDEKSPSTVSCCSPSNPALSTTSSLPAAGFVGSRGDIARERGHDSVLYPQQRGMLARSTGSKSPLSPATRPPSDRTYSMIVPNDGMSSSDWYINEGSYFSSSSQQEGGTSADGTESRLQDVVNCDPRLSALALPGDDGLPQHANTSASNLSFQKSYNSERWDPFVISPSSCTMDDSTQVTNANVQWYSHGGNLAPPSNDIPQNEQDVFWKDPQHQMPQHDDSHRQNDVVRCLQQPLLMLGKERDERDAMVNSGTDNVISTNATDGGDWFSSLERNYGIGTTTYRTNAPTYMSRETNNATVADDLFEPRPIGGLWGPMLEL